MRKNSRQLPGGSELAKILAQEAKRKLPPGKINIHYPDFSLAIKLFATYGENDLFQKELTAEEFAEKAKVVVDRIAKRILDDKITSEKAILFEMLYKKTLAPKILFSGRGPIYEPDRPVEAMEYRNLALAEGVPKEAIIVEAQSITIADNIKRSLNLLDDLKINFKKMILVNSPFSQRRGWCHFKKYLPDKIKLFRANCAAKPEYHKNNWFKNEAGTKIILNEFMKMKMAVILDTA